MKKNKKGFTLIELLAVIVILGIIITIVVSNVVKYIKQAREGSYKDAIVVFLKNTQTSIMGNQIDNNNSSIVVCDDDTTSSNPTTYMDSSGVTKNITKKCSDETDIYDYDKTNMKIRIVPSGATKYHVTITGINSFQNVTPKSIDKVTTGSGTAEFDIDSDAQLQ